MNEFDFPSSQWRDQPWLADAHCAQVVRREQAMENAWVDEYSPLKQWAATHCEACPVRMACALDAMTDLSSWGIRGGYFFRNGTVERNMAWKFQQEFGIKPKTRTRDGDFGHTRPRSGAIRSTRARQVDGDAINLS